MSALKINHREIGESELLKEWDLVKANLARDTSSPQLSSRVTLRYAKESIINRVLLEEEAEAIIDDIEYKLIQNEYDKILAHYGGWGKLSSSFPKSISPQKIKINIEKSLKVNKLLELWCENTDLPNEGEMMSYFERNRESFTNPPLILFSKFFLPYEPDPQNKVLIEGLLNYHLDQKNYQDFLNKAKSIPGLDYQEKFYLSPNTINPQVDDILRGLADEEMSGIIKTDEGYSLFKRWSSIPPRELEYDEVRESIEKLLFNEKKQKRVRNNLAKIRKNSIIEDNFHPEEEE